MFFSCMCNFLMLVLCGVTVCHSALVQAADGPGGAPASWPSSIVATVGPLQLRFESRSFWTLYRIDYQGKRICMDRWGSHYGSVAKFPGVGFIGSGHTENEDEVVLGLHLFVDGEEVSTPPETIACSTLRLEKRSRIRTLMLTTTVTVAGGRIRENVELTADVDTPVDLVYHFMHPWVPTMTDYLGVLLDGTEVAGTFDNDKAMEIDKATRWSAVYENSREIGALTYVISAPETHWRTRYWDVPERYRKHYFTTFMDKMIPAGTPLAYEILTVPFTSPSTEWQVGARRIANDLVTSGGQIDSR